MKISKELTDDAVLEELGRRFSHRRLALGMTQAALANEAGLSKRTVERIEAGASAQLSNVIRLLRTLDLIQGLDVLVSEPMPSPLELLKLGKRRQRASSEASTRAHEAWTWGDET